MQPRRLPLHGQLHTLHGVRLKMNRAQEHAAELRRGVEAWLGSQPYGFFGEYEPGPPEAYVFKVRYLEPIPPQWSVILGDFAHNARSALDHLAYTIVQENNGGNHEWTRFPICVVPWEWPKQCKRGIGGASDRHKAIVESYQPYYRKDLWGYYSGMSAIEDPLAVLNRISNIDKHIVLNPTPAVMQAIGYDFEHSSDIASVGNSAEIKWMLLDGEEIIRVPIVSNGPAPYLRLTVTERIEIRLQFRADLGKDGYTLVNTPLIETLDEIAERLQNLLKIFVGEIT